MSRVPKVAQPPSLLALDRRGRPRAPFLARRSRAHVLLDCRGHLFQLHMVTAEAEAAATL